MPGLGQAQPDITPQREMKRQVPRKHKSLQSILMVRRRTWSKANLRKGTNLRSNVIAVVR